MRAMWTAAIVLALAGTIAASGAKPDESPAAFPDTLTDVHGERIDVGDLVTRHRLVVVTLKATWCRVCQRQLVRLQEHLSRLQSCNATFIVLAPGPRDELRAIAESTGFPYPFVEDDGLRLARSLDLVLAPGEIVPAMFTVDERLAVDWIQRGRGGGYFGDTALLEHLECPPMQQVRRPSPIVARAHHARGMAPIVSPR
jgi:peroxiredoxin